MEIKASIRGQAPQAPEERKPVRAEKSEDPRENRAAVVTIRSSGPGVSRSPAPAGTGGGGGGDGDDVVD
jgi:hypothetical protein